MVRGVLRESELTWEEPRPGTFVVTLPGEHKLSTTCSLVVGDHSLSVNAFVLRRPEENHEAVYRWLLERNARMYGVAFALDQLGDVYLVGRIGLHAVTPEEVDRLLGGVLEHADSSFNKLLELGYGTAIRREWEWRVKRGESLANLQAFAHFADPDRR
ncbi:YbjN domain-containing protein [Carbonactinospora thermoautotrophica]|uniref:YbjN domain-containing protein n=1 Tax=Carbonactinospora thermoautotrophica TaxID=1469144 RepID=A0A132NHK9_9ACTN|nr:hypothetical protein TH66_22180 [Carbonactinospora thermoautotrophica]KWX09625.1 hypothetical protein TR74_08465 [Carbonactinospora thermoautotrophica]MCX9193223.1 YbjN domain-containing protein [Carbonactinospora thermoautotrophica]